MQIRPDRRYGRAACAPPSALSGVDVSRGESRMQMRARIQNLVPAAPVAAAGLALLSSSAAARNHAVGGARVSAAGKLSTHAIPAPSRNATDRHYRPRVARAVIQLSRGSSSQRHGSLELEDATGAASSRYRSNRHVRSGLQTVMIGRGAAIRVAMFSPRIGILPFSVARCCLVSRLHAPWRASATVPNDGCRVSVGLAAGCAGTVVLRSDRRAAPG